uniref:Uncharacterized protein n=1 Tax=Graphocephala atropunctata TaxID=36148 RepID=A0A1B6MIW5_9HEMI
MWSICPVWAILAVQCGLCLSQSTSTSSAQQSPSYGTLFAEDFNKNMAAVEKNMYKGAVSVTDPLIKFAIDTAPNLAHIYAMFNGINVPSGIASFSKDLYGKAAVGGGKLLGGAAVLGSSVIGNGLGTLGNFMESKNSVVDSGVRSGMKLAGEMADRATEAVVNGAGAASGTLTAVGDGLIAAGSGVNVISDGISQLINAITARLVLAIQSAQKLATDILDARDNFLKNGILAFDTKTQESVYSALKSYVIVLSNLQDLFRNFIKSFTGAASSSSANSASGASGSSTQ